MIRGHDGNYYGTTSFGGAHNLGTVYRMSASGAVTALYSFAGPDGEEPRAPLVLANDGTLCGAIKARALSDFVAFLKRTTGRQPPSAWYAHVTRLIDLARSRDRESILRALEESEEPALTIYARLERMRVQDVRRADQ